VRRGIHARFWWESQTERGYPEDLDIGCRIMLKLILEKLDGVVRTGFIWAQDRDKCRALVNTVMKLRVP
jgi:hypothetical protein